MNKEPRKVISIGFTDIKLHHTENAWKPSMKQAQPETNDTGDGEKRGTEVITFFSSISL